MIIIKESAPHIRRKATVARMMTDVLIALAPTLFFSFVVFPLQTLSTYLISIFIMVGSEFVFVGLKNMMPNDGQKHSFKERFIYAYKGKYTVNNILAPLISAIIFTLIMPAGAPIYSVITGALFGIIIGKLVFGGLGSNIFNPAALGMIFSKICFGSNYQAAHTWFYDLPVDATAGATALGNNGALINNLNEFPLLDLFLGRVPGTLGEVYKITIIIGLVYLLARRSADFRIVLSFLSTFILLSLVAGLSIMALDKSVNPLYFTLYNLLSGGALFGVAFMLTDPVTSPINGPSRFIYGMVAAIFTLFIRLFAAVPEGMGFSILISNMVAVVLDHYEWSNSRYTWKKILAIGILFTLSALIIFLAIRFGGVYNAE